MKKIILYSFTLLLFLILLSISTFNNNNKINNDGDNDNGIALLITPYNNEYFSNELIWINVKVLNNSNTDYKMIGDLSLGSGYLSLSVKDENGKILNSILTSETYAEYKPDTVIISPGQVAENDINLGWYIFSNKNKKIIVDASYNDLNSNHLEIPIIEPEGFEKEMLDLWNEYEFALRKNKIDDELRFKVIEFNNKYPQSRYIPQLYDDLLLNLLGYKFIDLYLQEFNKYMEVNANHPTTNFLFPTYKSYLKNIEHLTNAEIVDKFNDLIQDYPQSENFKKYVQRNIKLNFNKDKAWFVNED